jgi:hypothetical protein
MIVRPPTTWTLLGGFGLRLIALSVWATLHDQVGSGLVGLGLGFLFILLTRSLRSGPDGRRDNYLGWTWLAV